VPPLIRALEDSSDLVVIAAARALGRAGDPRALPALAGRIRWPEFRAVREACEAAIRSIRESSGHWGGEMAPASAPAGSGSELAPEPARGAHAAPEEDDGVL